MKMHLKVGLVILVLAVAAAAFIYTQAPKRADYAPAHVHQEGEDDDNCPICQAEKAAREATGEQAQSGVDEHALGEHAHNAQGEQALGAGKKENRAEYAQGEQALGEATQAETKGIEVAESKKPDAKTFTAQLPAATGKRTRVRIDTSMGAFEVLLYDDLAPRTVKNFLDLTGRGFYKNMIFHRVIKNFMNQTGDPTGTGTGGPGYKFDNEIVPQLRHNQPGVVAMANAGANTNGSQFYITVRPTPHLDGGYSVFGQVVKGLDVVIAINNVATGAGDRPLTPVEFRGVEVLGQE